MKNATIHFADNSSINISEGDFIIPVVAISDIDSESFTSMGEPLEIYTHVHDGLIPSITTAICQCSFFYLNRNNNVIYSTSAIVRIENN